MKSGRKERNFVEEKDEVKSSGSYTASHLRSRREKPNGEKRLWDGVSDFLTKIHWQTPKTKENETKPNENCCPERGRCRANPNLAQESNNGCGYAQLAEMEREKEARRAHRRRRSSRTKSCHKSRHPPYFQSRDQDQPDQQSPRDTLDKNCDLVEEHFSYGDIGHSEEPKNPFQGQKVTDPPIEEKQKVTNPVDEVVPLAENKSRDQSVTDIPPLLSTDVKINDPIGIFKDKKSDQKLKDESDLGHDLELGLSTSRREFENVLKLSMPPLNFDAPLRDQIDFQHRQNMNYLDAYLGSVVDARTKPMRLTLTPQLPPQVGLGTTTNERQLPESQLKLLSLNIKPISGSKRIKEGKLSYFENLRKTFSLARGLKVKNKLDNETLERIKRAKMNRGPFWRVEIFEKTRALNKIKRNSYAITFGFKFKKSEAQRRKLNLIDFGKLLNYKKKDKYKEGKFNYQQEQLNNLNNYYPINSPDLSQEIPNHNLNFDNLLQNPQNMFEQNFAKTREPTRVKRGHSNNHGADYSLSPVSPILEDSSKLSEKTKSLLEQVSLNSGNLPVGQIKGQVSNKLFRETTLAKIYTPKTQFTKQFASLLPSYNRDKLFLDLG